MAKHTMSMYQTKDAMIEAMQAECKVSDVRIVHYLSRHKMTIERTKKLKVLVNNNLCAACFVPSHRV